MLATRNISPDASWVERREQRHKLLIRARMRAGGLPVEVCINNVSTRGICAVTASPPPRGTYVELVDIPVPLVGKVIWSSNRRFGIAVQDNIDLPRLVAHRPGGAAMAEPAARVGSPKMPIAHREQRSREAGRRMQFIVLAAAVVIAATLIGTIVYSYLAQAVEAVGVGLRS